MTGQCITAGVFCFHTTLLKLFSRSLTVIIKLKNFLFNLHTVCAVLTLELNTGEADKTIKKAASKNKLKLVCMMVGELVRKPKPTTSVKQSKPKCLCRFRYFQRNIPL